jgi:hypothetical protein
MVADDARLRELDAPEDRPIERIDAQELPPPEPLRRTLERLAELDPAVVLVQRNDRVPRHLFPKLDERGYEYAVSEGEPVVTAVWRGEP